MEQLRLQRGSFSGSEGQAACQDLLPAWTLEGSAAKPGSLRGRRLATPPKTESGSDPSRIEGISRTLSSGSSQPHPEDVMAGVAGPQIDWMPGGPNCGLNQGKNEGGDLMGASPGSGRSAQG